MTVPRLWHISDVVLSIGDVIPPGRFGQEIIAGGGTAEGPPSEWPPLVLFFFRECMIEHIRATRAPSAVSRLECAFAFELREMATTLAAIFHQPCYEVAAADPRAPISRHDMAWIAWIGRPGTLPSDVIQGIKRYWTGLAIEPGDEPSQWEWLSSSGLRVVGDA